MPRFSPLAQDPGDQLIRADPDIAGPDDEVVRSAVVEIGELVGGQSGILMVPAVHELADGRLNDPGKIADDEAGAGGRLRQPVRQ